jgi:cyclohexanone monooxygenase
MPFGWDASVNEKSALQVSDEERRREYEARWERGGLWFYGAFADLLYSAEANETAKKFFRDKIREIVRDPAVADLLTPQQTFGCKRLCQDTGYYETFNRSNVTLVDVRKSPIVEITPHGLRTKDAEYRLDSIVFATGFDAMTGTLLKADIRGKGGVELREKWSEGPRTYLGVAVAGFPNLFIMTGPGSPSVLSNMVASNEQHASCIGDCIAYMRKRGIARIEPTDNAQDEWVSHVNEVAAGTLLLTCSSWYLGANIPGKPRVFMPYLGFAQYREKCEDVAANHYRGFAFA